MDWDDEWLNDGGWDWTAKYYDDKPKEKTCKHEWVMLELITSKVYDCKHCGMKKEDWEKENK